MRITYEISGNKIPSGSCTWNKVQNVAVLYTDDLVIDKFYGLVVEIDQHKVVVEVPDDSKNILSPDEFVCNKWSIFDVVHHTSLRTYSQPSALVLLERREMIEDATKESKETRE